MRRIVPIDLRNLACLTTNNPVDFHHGMSEAEIGNALTKIGRGAKRIKEIWK